MSGRREGARAATLSAALALAALTGCSSPEADRARGGGAGADPGNRDVLVQFHDGADMYHDVPCETTVECNGPAAVFGLPEPTTDSSD